MTAKQRARRAVHAAAPGRPGDHRVLHAAVALLGFVVCGLASVHMGQDNNWDLRNYHYYNAYAFLHDRVGFDIAPAQRQTYLNPLADVPFYLGARHLNPRLFGFLLGGIQGLSAGLIFAIAFVVFRRFAPKRRLLLSLACAGLGAYAPVLVGELGASPNDSLLGLLVLVSVWLYTRALARSGTLDVPGARRSLIVASLVLGMTAGLKLTLVMHVIAVAAALAVVESSWRSRVRVLGVFSLATLAGFLVTNGYWMMKMQHEFDNPLFPFYNHVFRSTWADPRSYADLSMVPQSFKQAVALPVVLCWLNPYTMMQGQYRDGRFAVLFVLLIVLAAYRLVRRMIARRSSSGGDSSTWSADSRFLLVFFVVSFVLWEASFNIVRYTASLEAIAPLLIVVVVCALSQRPAVQGVVIAAMFVPLALLMRPVQLPRLPWGDRFWDIRVPEIADTQSALIIVANDRPVSYLAPMFPPGVRWVSLNNNLTTPETETRMQEEIRRLVDVSRTIYLLTRTGSRDWIAYDRYVLGFYGLDVVENTEQSIVSRYTGNGLELVRLRRMPAGSPAPPAPQWPPRD